MWVLAALAAAVWVYLILGHGGFWRADQRLDPAPESLPGGWPEVVAVIPARDEEESVGACLASLVAQDYPGRFSILLVDDHSEDRTRAIAEELAARPAAAGRLAVVAARDLEPGWSGKLWAVNQGVLEAAERAPNARYLLLTDADIRHPPENLRRLVARAEAQRLDLTSLMVRLDHRGLWAQLLIPAFVFFFQKLYPFPWVNNPHHPLAAAAGGCMLVRRDSLERAGGLARIRGALIDDCALAALLKQRSSPRRGGGRLWLGLSSSTVSLRPYHDLREIWTMVARTAYTQLRYSPALLAGTLAGMVLVYLVAPLMVLLWPWHHDTWAAVCGIVTWGLMVVAWAPTLRLYHLPPGVGILLPVAGLLYSMMTVSSALRHWRGRGGFWKGRVYPGSGPGAGAGEQEQ